MDDLEESPLTLITDLTNDCLGCVLEKLDCVSLGQLCSSSKHFHELLFSTTSEGIWRSALMREFGIQSPSAPSPSHQIFSYSAKCPLSNALACEARHASFVHAVERFQVRIVEHASGSLIALESSKQLIVTPQSIWIKYQLPRSFIVDNEANGLTCTLEAEMGLDIVPLIVSEGFKLPANDLEMLLQSHREGLYVWTEDEEEGGDGDSGGDGDEGIVSIMAYIHYEQSILALAKAHLLHLLPQSLALPFMPTYWPSCLKPKVTRSLERCGSLFILMDWNQLTAPGFNVEAKSRGSAMIELKHSCPLGFSCNFSGLKLALPPSSRETLFLQSMMGIVPQVEEDIASKIKTLDALCMSDGMIDLSIWSSSGRLILGRAGVEVWLKNEVEEFHQSYCCHFLIDGLSNKDQTLWDNCLWIRPRTDGSRVIELNLPEEVAVSLGMIEICAIDDDEEFQEEEAE